MMSALETERPPGSGLPNSDDVATRVPVVPSPEKRAAGFTQVRNDVLRDPSLSIGARMTFALLESYRWKGKASWPSQQTLAAGLGVSDRQTRDYLRELEAAGLIQTRRPGKKRTNRYAPLDRHHEPSVNPQVTGTTVPLTPLVTGTTVPLHSTKTQSSYKDSLDGETSESSRLEAAPRERAATESPSSRRTTKTQAGDRNHSSDHSKPTDPAGRLAVLEAHFDYPLNAVGRRGLLTALECCPNLVKAAATSLSISAVTRKFDPTIRIDPNWLQGLLRQWLIDARFKGEPLGLDPDSSDMKADWRDHYGK